MRLRWRHQETSGSPRPRAKKAVATGRRLGHNGQAVPSGAKGRGRGKEERTSGFARAKASGSGGGQRPAVGSLALQFCRCGCLLQRSLPVRHQPALRKIRQARPGQAPGDVTSLGWVRRSGSRHLELARPLEFGSFTVCTVGTGPSRRNCLRSSSIPVT